MKIIIRENKSAYTDKSIASAVRLAVREHLNDQGSPLIVDVSYAQLCTRVAVRGRHLCLWLAPQGEWIPEFASNLRWAMMASNNASRGVLQRTREAPPPDWHDRLKLVRKPGPVPKPTRDQVLLEKIEHARMMREQWAKAERSATRLHAKWHAEHTRLVKLSELKFREAVKSKRVQLDFAEADAAFEAAT
jgi:hypothetical protein